jgi:muconolactone delta-isomerase
VGTPLADEEDVIASPSGREVAAHLAARSQRKAEGAMQYLVTMTTHVPQGVSPEAVSEVRDREAACSRQLAAEGHLVRLWRPPSRPGEWRSIGLFAAGEDRALEQVLASMPLRVWRSDEVTPLTPHPNDPGPDRERRGGAMEFLVSFVMAVPSGTSRQAVEEAGAREVLRSRELAGEGRLVRLWALPGRGHAIGLYRAHDLTEMEALVEALPLRPMMTAEITPLTPHPNDPASAGPAWDAEKSAFAVRPAP